MGNEISDDDELFEKNVDQMEEDELGGDIDNIDIDLSKSCESREKDIVDNNNDFDKNRVFDGEDNRPSHPIFNLVMVFDHTFEIGMIFGTKAEFRKVVQSHTIRTKRTLKFIKNDKIRVYVRCSGEECEWRINALKMNDECTFQIREYNPKHLCPPTFHVKNVKTNWLSEKYHVSKQQAYRAKRKALSMIEGNPDIQYSKLWDYAEELRKTNPGSTIILGTEEKNGDKRFRKFYVCFNALKIGFLSGCRPIIWVDGCHLKGPHGGVLLIAFGVDLNNNLYPITYAVVCKECRNTWEWFLIILKNDLNIVRHHEYTFMSDKQKGLIQAFEEVFPDSNNRFCIRHLHNNFKNARYRGLAFKNALWRAAQATMLADWFHDKPPTQWSKSYFNEGPKCDMLLNNVCETFNSNILYIREYLMRRLQENRDRAETKWKGKLCPKIKKIIEKHIDKVADCIPIKSDDRHYQVSCFDGSQYTVHLDKLICTCRQWELSGIPCKHAICAILNQNELLEDYVHSCYNVETYKQVYRPAILGIRRPSTTRKMEPDELHMKKKKRSRGNQTLKLKKQQITVKCRLCGVLGHNYATCPSNLDNLTVNIDTRVTIEMVGEEHAIGKARTKLMLNPPRSTTKHNISQVEGTSQLAPPFLLRSSILPPESATWIQIEAYEIPSQLSQVTTMTSYQQSQMPHMFGPSIYQQLQMFKSGMNQNRKSKNAK
ncbi:hypothetical protein Pfo_004015 [Paulownia fortunei]|nr:hypothetical protein Pfo_004015 [Paulownia fortunei]